MENNKEESNIYSVTFRDKSSTPIKDLEVIENHQKGVPQLPLSPFDNQIITFYSDRNLKERMVFKNPKVAEYYTNKDNKDNQNNIIKRKKRWKNYF